MNALALAAAAAPARVPPDRPALRWHGGKWLLAPWIIGHFPPHRIYVEPFGGAASVLLRKPRAYGEIYNDLDCDVVNLFVILRDPDMGAELIRRLKLTPFARAEFKCAYLVSPDPIEEARNLIIRSLMGFGSDGFNREVKTGFRANSNRSGTTPAHDWANYPDSLVLVIERLSGVVIEQRDAMDIMLTHDGPDTLHYVDPPYMPETRSDKGRRGGVRYHAYRHELTDADHERLLDGLKSLTGMVVLSGYPSPLYESALSGWRRIERQSLADGARPRMEVLWLNPACASRLERPAQHEFFAGDGA
jgi:DNA adenine methylase